MDELLKEIKINNRADALLAPIGKKIETMSADDYRRVMAQLKREKLI